MKFKFDANQDFQLDAVNAVVDIFEGQKKMAEATVAGGLFGIYPNNLTLSNDDIATNLYKVQIRNKIKKVDAVADNDFSVEMETGTGKTYVYLRTIFELNKRYGWKKFIILVPSVAIREGVVKTLQITKEHFGELYDNVPYRFYEYRSKNISQVKHFADDSNVNIMVMTVGAFNRDANVLYTERDQMQGEQPISYIQKTNPILILDEPQNMEGEATKEALKNFNSLFRLRYSATHRIPYNLLYQLTPADAYRLGLVKKIEVFSVTDDDTGLSRPYLNLVTVVAGKIIKATVEAMVKDAEGSTKKKKIIIKQGDDLSKKTNNDIYIGYVVEDLTVDAPDFGAIGTVRFRNNIELKQGEGIGDNRDQLMREQITQTIRLHFEKRHKLREQGIKVLSLFFIDKVNNYTLLDGFIRKTFISEFDRLKVEYNAESLDTEKVHKGYFAKRGEEYLERDSAIAENQEAYELIMRDKERLLSFDEPTEFIFSHSALKEGWDNPNVFNICTLRHTAASLRKRQEIGRGMRLCVNQDGERVFLKHINVLSVIANENYADYVGQLQDEFVEDGIFQAPPIPANARQRRKVKLKKGFEKHPDFASLWERISKKTKYIVHVNTERLVEACSRQISELAISKPQIHIERAGVEIGEGGVNARLIGNRSDNLLQTKRPIDCIEFIKNETKLTRHTVATILATANNATSFLNNPERFCFEVARLIKTELLKDYLEQIRYELMPDRYAVGQFETEVDSYDASTQPVHNSIYDAIVYQSDVEKNFAVSLDSDERIKLFIKLPSWFKVETPVGGYNPDWAIVTSKRDLQGNDIKERVYFVIETKGDVTNLRRSEQEKVLSAKKHFEAISVNYTVVDNFQTFTASV